MPKTRKQKQDEAIERLRKSIPVMRDRMLRSQRGGDLWKAAVTTNSQKHADYLAEVTLKNFKRQCEEARVDTHGNPL